MKALVLAVVILSPCTAMAADKPKKLAADEKRVERELKQLKIDISNDTPDVQHYVRSALIRRDALATHCREVMHDRSVIMNWKRASQCLKELRNTHHLPGGNFIEASVGSVGLVYGRVFQKIGPKRGLVEVSRQTDVIDDNLGDVHFKLVDELMMVDGVSFADAVDGKTSIAFLGKVSGSTTYANAAGTSNTVYLAVPLKPEEQERIKQLSADPKKKKR